MGKFGKLCCRLGHALQCKERGLWGAQRRSEVMLGVAGLVRGWETPEGARPRLASGV